MAARLLISLCIGASFGCGAVHTPEDEGDGGVPDAGEEPPPEECTAPVERVVVAKDGDRGLSPILLAGAAERRRIVHRNRDTGTLELATFDGVAWNNRALAGTAGAGAFAAAEDPSGQMHLLWVRGGGVTHRLLADDGATDERLPLTASSGSPLALAIDATGALHVAYSDFEESGAGFGMPTGGIRYATTDRDGVWVDRSIAEIIGSFDLAVTATEASVAYVSRDGVRLARGLGDSWTDEIVDEEIVSSVDLAVDVEGAVHVLGIQNDHLLFATAGSGFGDPVELAGGVYELAWTIGADGAKQVLYVTRSEVVRYATDGSGRWETSSVMRGRQTRGAPALAIDGGGVLRAAFYDWNDGALVVDALNADSLPCGAAPPELSELGRWRNETVVGVPAWPVPVRSASIDLAIGPDGELHAAYTFGAGRACCDTLRYATNASGSWRSEVFEEYARTFDLAVDETGTAHVVFESYGRERFRARGRFGSWTVEPAAEPEGTPPVDAAALAREASGRPLELVYSTFRELHHARFVGGAWESELVDPGEDMHLLMNISTVVDVDGRFHVGYVDHYGELRYASNAGGGWARTALDATYGNTAIALGPAGRVDLAYQVFGTVMLARSSDGDWTRTRLDSGAGAPLAVSVGGGADGTTWVVSGGGRFNSGAHVIRVDRDGRYHRERIAGDALGTRAVLGPDDRPHVLYYDYEADEIRHAVRR